ncbi:MAG: hypothetical protein OXK16_03800 [bacterium]|nr:hypothetical protein [bacterium]
MRAVVYVIRRWDTADGRANIGRWAVAVTIIAGYALSVRWLWSHDLIPSRLADLTTPWQRIRQQGEPDETLIPLAIALALLATLPLVARAAQTIHALRPWQPHSGGRYLARTSEPIPIPAASWSQFTQQLLLDRARAESEDSGHPGSGTVQRLLTPRSAPEQPDPDPPDGAEVSQPETPPSAPPPAPEPPSPTPILTDRLAAAVLEITPDPDQPTTPPAVWQGAAAAGGPVDTTGEEVAEAVGIPKVRLLRLCGDEWGMKLPRYSLLALIAYRGEATVAEAHRALDTSKSAAKSLLWRASRAGWVTWDGRQYWRLAEGVVTDVAALNAAVLRGEEEVAVTLAEGLGRPLHRAEGPMAAWIDDPIYAIRRSVRADLVEEAANALAAAVEKWPHRVAFRSAVDRIYGDAA